MSYHAEHKGNEHSAEFLSVRVGTQEFAIDIRTIREIRGWIASTHLPHAPPFIKGMINLRGSVLLVIDLAQRLGLPPIMPSAASVVVVVECGDKAVGLLVDAVCDIITVTEDMRQNTPETGSDVPKAYIEGLVMMESRIVSILLIQALIPDETVQKMADMAMA
ncbi:chemotaxis protein CheW [Acidocella sp.]|uniref:chemotaxis protein CheW n=1 Tax=Acidocella sp. TaxID=50710 RepID=UPI003D011223